MRRTITGLLGMAALVILLYLIGLSGRAILADYITQVAVGLTLMILGLGYWTFKPQLSRWLNPDDEAPKLTNTSVYETPIIGQPVRVDPQKVWHYDRRDQMNFPEFMKLAKRKIRMSALTFSLLTLEHEDLLCELASNKIKITFLILDPTSDEAKRQTSLYKSSDDLIDQINRSLQRLCKLKQQYSKNVFIKTYTELHGNSITILDDSTIKVEKHVVDSGPNSREYEIIFKKDSEKEFLNISDKFVELDKSSNEYPC